MAGELSASSAARRLDPGPSPRVRRYRPPGCVWV